MADGLGAPRERIAAFKQLAVQAAAQVADGADGYGVLLDGEHGREALFDAAEQNLWIGRPVERPGSRPLTFVAHDVGSHLVEWPAAHTVKCLCLYHPDDATELKETQERALLTVSEACRATRRELLVEIIAGKHGPVVDTTVAAVIERLYGLGIRPDWWKLEPQTSEAAWRAIERVIDRGDPFCRGVLLLGLDAPEDHLVASFAAAACNRIVKGFAVGRTIFSQTAEQWLSDTISDREAVAAMATRYRRLSDAWEQARRAA
jgi:5-dehydro-2-deoxygluconokinase